MHDEVFEATQDPATAARDSPGSAASSPSEAYANLTLESGEAGALRSSSPAKRLHSDMDEAPIVDDQVDQVMAIHNRPLVAGQEGYVISEKWLAKVFARTSENKNKPEQFDKDDVEGEIGAVDNSPIVDPASLSDDVKDSKDEDFVALRPGLTIGQDLEVIPPEAWELILSWHGLKDGSPVVRRYCVDTSEDPQKPNLQYELYPPVFTIRRVRRSDSARPKPSPKLVASRSDRYVDFLTRAKAAAGIDVKAKVRVWRVLKVAPMEQAPQPSGMLTPASSPRNGSPVRSTSDAQVNLVIDVASFTALADGTERELVTGKDEIANEKYNANATLAITGLAEDQVLILEEQDENGEYLTETSASQRLAAQKDGKVAGKAGKGVQGNTNSGRNSPALSGPMTRGRTRSGRTRGTVGLSNLGNTCYMNSALQCIRSIEELSLYFLAEKYKEDLNFDNALGHKGRIAKSYAGLLASIYSVDGPTSFSPKNFKQELGRAQPSFSGYGQQDSQEFLSFLVDGLHEDLNRVKKKPYEPNPESDDNTVHDPEAIKALGEKFRQNHYSRNDSVAMDLFNGFYKNTLRCPDCDRVSINFDAFSLLTLPLPVEQSWQHTVTFVPLRGPVVNIDIDIDKNATIKALKEYVAKRFEGLHWTRLMGAEVYTHKFYRVLDNNKSISESNIQQRDVIFMYELEDTPTNWPSPKKKQQSKSMLSAASSEEDLSKTASPLAEKLLVPIFHRVPKVSYTREKQWSLALWPSYIVVSRDEAKDYDAILRKVLGKVAQMTTFPLLTEGNSELSGTSHSQSIDGSDIVLTTEEDASPNGDPCVQDGSVEGEDNMVEVTMAEPGETSVDPATEAAKDETPEVLRPGSSIGEAFRSMFDMKYTRPGKEIVPTGWSSTDNNHSLESLNVRVQALAHASGQSSATSVEGDANSNASSSEDVDEIHQSPAEAQSAIELANQSSDEEMQESFARSGRQNSRKDKRKNKKFNKKFDKKNRQKYSKKGKNPLPSQPQQSFSDIESENDEGLIRLGEGIVLEWNEGSFNTLFGNVHKNDGRGQDTFGVAETLDDPELQEKKARRAARKKNGITLDECFVETTKKEVLTEDNLWYCSRCKEQRRATKILEIWTVPDILVIHLKRFSAHRSFRDKIEAFVDCPLEGLDLTGKVGLPEDKSLVYDLFAVDNHYGGLGGGHYTACARNFFDGKWYDYNDSSVSPRKPDSVVSPAAYLLFYRRRSDRPLGPPYIQKIVEQFRNPDSEITEDDFEGANSRNPSPPAGNGLRLGDLSPSGSSSGFGAGAVVLHGGGSTSAENLLSNGVAAGTADDDSEMLDQGAPPPYDEGYADGVYDRVPLGGLLNLNNSPDWGFDQIDGDDDETFDEAASDMVNMGGSTFSEDADNRLQEDFGHDIVNGIHPGASTPLEEEILPEDDEVADIVLDDELSPTGHVKMD